MKILPPYLVLFFAILMVICSRALPILPIFPNSWRWFGLAFLLIGLFLTIFNGVRFKRTGTNIRPFRDPSRLVTDGFYAYTRNPMYLGMAVVLLGLALILGQMIAFLFPILFVVIINRVNIRFEEAAALRIFGEEYNAYRRKVRRWI